MFRRRPHGIEVFLIHPGGPFWAKKDLGVWSIPKGEYLADEEPVDAARREFSEETGFTVAGQLLELGSITQPGGKIVTAWAFEGDCDPSKMVSNYTQIQWPPRSGHLIDIPEADRSDWFTLSDAAKHIIPRQIPLLDRLGTALKL